MTKSLTRELHLKQKFIMMRLAEGASIKGHIKEFKGHISIFVKFSFWNRVHHFEYVKAALLSKDILDKGFTSVSGEGQDLEAFVSRGHP